MVSLFGIMAILLVASCSSSDNGRSNASAPIKIGAVSSLTGPAPFPEVPAAAKVVFDKVNARGGIQGRKIRYVSVDDAADPAIAGQAARRLVDEDDVVAMAGGASLVDCTANATFYEKRDVVSIMGAGIEPACFTSPNIAPVNAGTFNGYETLLYFAKDQLGAKRICPVILKSEALTEPYLDLLKRWQRTTGTKFAHIDTSVNLGGDPTPAILAVEKARCDAVVVNPTEPEGVALLKLAKQQGVFDEANWLMLANVYTQAALKAFQAQGTTDRVYVNSEFVPFTGDDSTVTSWRNELTGHGVPVTSLAQGGYVSAEILIQVLESIDGPITTESVAAAFRQVDTIDNPLLGMPFTFGESKRHNPNRASKMVQATADGWQPVGDWVRLPNKS